MKHRSFGQREEGSYFDRRGAYLIPMKGEQVGLVHTHKGLFLLGGGMEGEESELQCIQRECLEEIGYRVQVDHKVCTAETFTRHHRLGLFHPIQSYYVGRLIEKIQPAIEADHKLIWMHWKEAQRNMYAPMQSWAIEQCWLDKTDR